MVQTIIIHQKLIQIKRPSPKAPVHKNQQPLVPAQSPLLIKPMYRLVITVGGTTDLPTKNKSHQKLLFDSRMPQNGGLHFELWPCLISVLVFLRFANFLPHNHTEGFPMTDEVVGLSRIKSNLVENFRKNTGLEQGTTKNRTSIRKDCF